MERPTALVNNPLHIGEIIKIHVQRAKPSGGWEPLKLVDSEDLVVNAGRTFLAQRIGANVNSPMAHMAVGTVSTAPALTDTQPTGEVDRKALAVNSAITNNVYTAVSTFGGFADSVTSLSLVEGAILNHAASGQGTMFQRVTFAAVVLANSDILSLTMETNVGSNTI